MWDDVPRGERGSGRSTSRVKPAVAIHEFQGRLSFPLKSTTLEAKMGAR